MNEIQSALFEKIKHEICDSVSSNPVNKNAIEVVTPFVDCDGSPLSIFITEDGRITDGGEVLSHLKSLRTIEDFNNWEFKLDFLHRYSINQVRGRLELTNMESLANILKYIQGISRIPNYFEPKPIYDTSDKFPSKVRKMAVAALLPFAPSTLPEEDRVLWAKEFTAERPIKLNGIAVQSDMSPKKYFRMVQIISHATSGSTDRRQHVEAKILHPVLWKRKESRVELYVIVEELNAYAPESRTLLRQESNDNIIEICDSGAEKEIARILLEEPTALSN